MTTGKVLAAGLLVLATATAALGVDMEGIEVTRFLPEFQTDKAVERIEEGLAPAKELDSALRENTDRIWQLVEEYRKAPSVDQENKIYNAVASTGKTIIEHITDLQGKRDQLRDELRDLTFNVDGVVRNIGSYTTGLDGRVKDIVEEAKGLKDELSLLAKALTDNPEDTEKREEFRRKVLEVKRLQMKVGIFQRNREMYEQLAEQIGKVARFFQEFDGRLDAVLESLAVQKSLIAMNLTVLRDKAKVVAWLRGEAGGQEGAAGLVKQLGELSSSVQGFEKVMDVMMNLGGGFDDFAEVVPELADPSIAPVSSVSDEELDQLIAKFAKGE